MVRAVTPQVDPASTPVDLRKRTDRELTDMWCEMKLAIDGLKGPMGEVGEILLERSTKTGKRFYKASDAVDAAGISVDRTGGQLGLDQAKIKAFLGDRLHEFQTRSKRGWTLKLHQ